MERVLGHRSSFDPSREQHTFNILASDYVVLVLLGPLLSELSTQAPGVRIRVRPVGGDYAELLRTGQVDLFILPQESENSDEPFHSLSLFDERLVCVADRHHPDLGETLSREQFASLPYLAYDDGSVPSSAQIQLKTHGMERRIDVATQSFVLAPFLLPGTRFITLMHERLAHGFAGQTGLQLFEPPVALTPITETMYWTSRHQNSPAHSWLRERIVEAATALDRSSITFGDEHH